MQNRENGSESLPFKAKLLPLLNSPFAPPTHPRCSTNCATPTRLFNCRVAISLSPWLIQIMELSSLTGSYYNGILCQQLVLPVALRVMSVLMSFFCADQCCCFFLLLLLLARPFTMVCKNFPFVYSYFGKKKCFRLLFRFFHHSFSCCVIFPFSFHVLLLCFCCWRCYRPIYFSFGKCAPYKLTLHNVLG